jgi:tetratricopeptide (TPR) repeat protein
MRPSITLLLAILAFVVSLAHAETAGSLIAQGDAFDVRLQTADALAVYLKAEKLEPANAELLVKIAKQYGESMVTLTKADDKRRIGGIAVDYAKRAVALAPKSGLAHLALAICYGRVILVVPNKTKVEYSRLVRDNVELATKLDPSQDFAWHVLGRWHQGVSTVNGVLKLLIKIIYGGLPKASLPEAVACFEKAIKLNPDRLCHVIELGRTYAFMEKYAEARKLIERGLAMPNKEPDDPRTKDRGRDTLKEIRGK